jgi:anaphase-promoting complex subunit 2
MSQFSEAYGELKRTRRLEWLKHLGQVKVELAFEDRTLEIETSPSQAAAIWMFQSGPKSLAEIAVGLNLDETIVWPIIQFWLAKGVLRSDADSNRYTVMERLGEQDNVDAEDVVVSLVLSAEERANEEMKVYWKYIVGMLTNVGPMPVNNIHSFLKMAVPKEIAYTKSQDELEQYLSIKVDEEVVELSGGRYKLK